jgi:hypothetical protein
MTGCDGWGKRLLWLHLFVMVVWLCVLRATRMPPEWMLHVVVWSVLIVQFTWGFTVGLAVGPGRRRRAHLWWSLLTVLIPLYVVSFVFRVLVAALGLPMALVYLAVFVTMLACETYCGVLLGARMHRRFGRD